MDCVQPYNMAVVDIKLRLRCRHLANSTKQRRTWFCLIMWKHDVIHKTGSIALSSQDDRATVNAYRKFREV